MINNQVYSIEDLKDAYYGRIGDTTFEEWYEYNRVRLEEGNILDELIIYVAGTEVVIDQEIGIGAGRSLHQLIADNDMPFLYHKLLVLKNMKV